MTQRRNSKSQGRKEVKSSLGKNGVPSEDSAPSGSAPSSSWFGLVLVLALLGLWSSMAVVYFDVVDYDSVLARAKELRLNFTQVLQGKLSVYDSDGDGDFDLDDAKVLLGLKSRDEAKAEAHSAEASQQKKAEPKLSHDQQWEAELVSETWSEVQSDQKKAKSAPPQSHSFVPDDARGEDALFSQVLEREAEAAVPIDSTGELVKEAEPQPTLEESGEFVTSSKFTQEQEPAEEKKTKPGPEPGPDSDPEPGPDSGLKPEEPTEVREEKPTSAASQTHEKVPDKDKGKKKKPKLLNKFDKGIKSEIDSAEKLRKKGKVEEALSAFEDLVHKYPLSPRARFGKAQCEDDLAEKLRSNEMLHRAIATYREAAELPDAPEDLLKGALKRRADRQQFLGRTRGSLMTLEKLVQMFPDEVSLKNDLGVAHLLLGDNKGAKAVYQQVLAVAPDDGFAKVHYGFILKSENKISESVSFLREGLLSGEPGTDDGRFYFHLGDALQRLGQPEEAHSWYSRGHQRGHFSSVWQRSLYNVAGLKAQPWWTPRETGYTELVKSLERNWKVIRDEALSVMDQESALFVPEEENLRERGQWGQYTLWQQGRRAGSACQSVPKTCALMEKFPEATGCKRGQIKFSVMQPGTHVWPHTGPTNCRLRLHLGLVIPESGCRIRCTDSTREWEEGKVLIFDDSFEHEVWQEAQSFRLIFIVDVWHPELTPYQRQTLSSI